MSTVHTISAWKQKSEIDYFSLFVPLWLAFDAWCKDKYGRSTQRECLEMLKSDAINNKTYHKFNSLINGSDSLSQTFKNNLKQLNEALLASPIYYKDGSNTIVISLENGLTDFTSKIYENLFRTSHQSKHTKIEFIAGLYLTDDIQKIYKSYIEILYQARCALFHGNLEPNRENERIIKHLYLTLRDIAEQI